MSIRQKQVFVGLGVAIGIVLLVAYFSLRPGPTVGDFVERLHKVGLNGKFSPLDQSGLGAEEAGTYSGSGFHVAIYRFRDRSKARSLEKSGIDGKTCYSKGNLLLQEVTGDQRIVDEFLSFSSW